MKKLHSLNMERKTLYGMVLVEAYAGIFKTTVILPMA
jgi:hypothetical protein